MSTAVLLSGQVRTFASCLPTMQHHVFRKLKDPVFFCSVADDDQAGDIHLLEAHYPGRVHVERVVQPQIPEPAKKLAAHAPYAISSPVQAILRQLWALNRVWEFFQFECKSHPARTPTGDWLGSFETIVRCRPDLWFHEFAMPQTSFEFAVRAPMLSILPWWSRCGGVNDRFGIMGLSAAVHYFTTFAKLKPMLDDGCPLHPESLVAESLALGGVTVRNTLRATFSGLRPDGTRVPPREYPGELAAFLADSVAEL